MKKDDSKAQGVKNFLIFLLIVAVVGCSGAFYFGLQELRRYSVEVNHRLLDADASGKQIQQLQSLKTQLAQSQELITKANGLFATPDNYQSQALTDIKKHAANAGLSIASTEFDSANAATGGRAVMVTLSEPVSYKSLVTFLDGIESNLPKMQVSSLTLSRLSGGGADTIKVGAIKITVSVR